MLPNRFRHSLNQGGCGQHTCFESRGEKVFGHGIDLGPDHIKGDGVDGGDAQSVLGGNGCHRRGAEYTEGVKGLQISLDSRSSSAIRSGDGEGDRESLRVHFAAGSWEGLHQGCWSLSLSQSSPN